MSLRDEAEYQKLWDQLVKMEKDFNAQGPDDKRRTFNSYRRDVNKIKLELDALARKLDGEAMGDRPDPLAPLRGEGEEAVREWIKKGLA